MPRRTVTVAPGRKVSVSVCLDGIPPRRFWCPPPHTALTQAVASIHRGENFHGTLRDEFYLVQDDPGDPERLVLWIADTGSQSDDDQARLYPAAWARRRDFEEAERADRADIFPVAAAVLLYAYIREAVVELDGHYREDHTVDGSDDLKPDFLDQLFTDALTGKPFRPPARP